MSAIGKQPAVSRPIVIVVNYESAIRKELSEELLRMRYDIVVCDESHRIKGHGTQSSKLARRSGSDRTSGSRSPGRRCRRARRTSSPSTDS